MGTAGKNQATLPERPSPNLRSKRRIRLEKTTRKARPARMNPVKSPMARSIVQAVTAPAVEATRRADIVGSKPNQGLTRAFRVRCKLTACVTTVATRRAATAPVRPKDPDSAQTRLTEKEV